MPIKDILITIKERQIPLKYVQNSYSRINENSNDVDNLKQLVAIIINLTKQKDSIENKID